jgi:hypothetical protein
MHPKAEADGLIGFVDDELIADIEDIPPRVHGVSQGPQLAALDRMGARRAVLDPGSPRAEGSASQTI